MEAHQDGVGLKINPVVVRLLDVDTDQNEFVYQHKQWIKDHRVLTFLTKHLEMELKAVYTIKSNPTKVVRKTHKPFSKHQLGFQVKTMRWDQQTFLLFLKSGKLIHMQNSEWAEIGRHT